MIEDGKVTEGGTSSCFILTQDDVIVTRQNGSEILPGCTRKAVVKLAEERQLRIEERAFRSRRRWRPRKPSSPARACSCRRWSRSTARRSPTASPAR